MSLSFGTIPELLEGRAALAPDKPWLWFGSESWTLADVLAETDRMAVGLAERGVTHGDRVAIVLGNQPSTLFCWFAANRLGAIAAPFNPALKPAELEALIRLTTPRLVVGKDVTPEDLASAGSGAPRADVKPEDIAVLIATSGTTGAAKAVAQTHRSYALTAEAFPWWLGLTEADRLFTSLPLSHINAQAYSTLASLAVGASLALAPRFSASGFLAEAARMEATVFNAIGAMLHILLKREPSPEDRAHRLRLCYAALALPEAQHRAFEERFGVTMMVGYGLSETPFGTIWPRDSPAPYGTIGRLRQHPRLGEINHARLVDRELWLKNPAIMNGYWGAPEATAEVLAEGWLKTGDIVREEGGIYTFVSRKKEVIRRRGENVGAAEIETVLLSHPAVREAAAVGVPSELGEEDIVAYVAGDALDPETLRAFCSERLADFKVPSIIHVRDALPRTATQRVAKHLLK